AGHMYAANACTWLLVSDVFFKVAIQRWCVTSTAVLAHGFDHWWSSAQVGVGFALSYVLAGVHVVSDKATTLMAVVLGKHREEVKVLNTLFIRSNLFQAHQVFRGVGAVDEPHWDIEKLIVRQSFHDRHHWS